MANGIDPLYKNAWTAAQLGEALEVTARRTQLSSQPLEAPRVPDELARADDNSLDRWMMLAADTLGIEAEPITAAPADLHELAQNAAPAILQLPPRESFEAPRFLALVRGGTRPTVIDANLRAHTIDASLIATALSGARFAPWQSFSDEILDAARVPAWRRVQMRWKIVAPELDSEELHCGWILRLSPGTDLWRHIRRAGLVRIFTELVTAQIFQIGLLIAAWGFIGWITLTNAPNPAWLQAWALVLFTVVPVQLWMSNAQSRFALQLGLVFRQRLLFGTLRLKPDEIRQQGLGQFLERVMMAEQIENLAVGGGLLAFLALFELLAAVWILAQGAGGLLQVLVLIGFSSFSFVVGWNYYRSKRYWVGNYRQMTNQLVERMIGHRTRLAQQDPREWHTSEDAELERYVNLTERFDASFVLIGALPRLWLAVALLGLTPAFLTGAVTTTGLAIALGGIILAYNAFTTIVGGLSTLVNSLIAGEQVIPLFRAASRYTPISPAVLDQSWIEDGAAKSGMTPFAEIAPRLAEPVLRARSLVFRYREHGRAVLREVNLDVYAGDRILLEGPSGGGKTTLAAVLAGLRVPESGLVNIRGFDRQTVESEVTPRRVAMAPQFHENYIFNATFGFNLLMGRRVPPTEEDLVLAEQLCRELGLDELLARMPLGMNQLVGEHGWQLSHGERSRVYIARVLLQHADLVILDESFGALDPENMRRALECTLNRAPTLMVIAHP